MKPKAVALSAIIIAGLCLIFLSTWESDPGNPIIEDTVEPVSDIQVPAPPKYTDYRGNVGNLDGQIPASWEQNDPSSSIRLTQFSLKTPEMAELELAVFNQIGGSVDQNVDRWFEQFNLIRQDSDSRITEKTVNGMRVMTVKLTGTFSSDRMGGVADEIEQAGMLASIIITDEGPYYFKLTGDVKAIKFWESDFNQFINSLKFIKKS